MKKYYKLIECKSEELDKNTPFVFTDTNSEHWIYKLPKHLDSAIPNLSRNGVEGSVYVFNISKLVE